MNSIKNKKFAAAFVAAFLLSAGNAALAAGGGVGGLNTATSTASNVQIAMYSLAGACAGIYLLYLGMMAWTERKTWSDFGMGVVYVALVGAAGVLATWAWSMFTS